MCGEYFFFLFFFFGPDCRVELCLIFTAIARDDLRFKPLIKSTFLTDGERLLVKRIHFPIFGKMARKLYREPPRRNRSGGKAPVHACYASESLFYTRVGRCTLQPVIGCALQQHARCLCGAASRALFRVPLSLLQTCY